MNAEDEWVQAQPGGVGDESEWITEWNTVEQQQKIILNRTNPRERWRATNQKKWINDNNNRNVIGAELSLFPYMCMSVNKMQQ